MPSKPDCIIGTPATGESVMWFCIPPEWQGISNWFDPPFADGFLYTVQGGNFSVVGTPPASFGFGPVSLFVGGINLAILNPGDVFDFISHGLTDVQSFSLEGINPLLDVAAPGFSSSFPTFLGFNGQPTLMTMTALLEANAVPEPSTLALFGAGLAGMWAFRRRKARKA